MHRLMLILPAILLLATCDSSERSKSSDEDKDAGDGLTADAGDDTDFDAGEGDDTEPGCSKMDILFVIDDSGSMSCEQSKLGQAFPGFIQVLEDYLTPANTQVEYRVGVTSTGRTVDYTLKLGGQDFPFHEKGMDGKLNEVPGGGLWIDGPGSTVSSDFSATADLGTGGPSYEMPLESMHMALELTASGEYNDGFLREDSLFIVVFITDEDDCSRLDNDFEIHVDHCMTNPEGHNLVDLQEYKDYLDDKFGGESRYVVVSIAGASSCDISSVTCEEDDAQAGANDAVRMKDFINNYFEDNAVFSDICTEPMPDALSRALEKMQVACDEFTPVE